jgi:hypothetical protein
MGKTLRWVIPGSRPLLNDRAAILQSGSPPGRWAYDQPVFFRRDAYEARCEFHCSGALPRAKALGCSMLPFHGESPLGVPARSRPSPLIPSVSNVPTRLPAGNGKPRTNSVALIRRFPSN